MRSAKLNHGDFDAPLLTSSGHRSLVVARLSFFAAQRVIRQLLCVWTTGLNHDIQRQNTAAHFTA